MYARMKHLLQDDLDYLLNLEHVVDYLKFEYEADRQSFVITLLILNESNYCIFSLSYSKTHLQYHMKVNTLK